MSSPRRKASRVTHRQPSLTSSASRAARSSNIGIRLPLSRPRWRMATASSEDGCHEIYPFSQSHPLFLHDRCSDGPRQGCRRNRDDEFERRRLGRGLRPSRQGHRGSACQQPGFVSLETAVSGRKWLVVVHWKSVDAAQASMDSFAKAPAAAKFMSMIDASSMTMTRYEANR